MRDTVSVWSSELAMVGWLIAISWLVGEAVGLSYWIAATILFLYLCWHLYFLRKLVVWFDTQGKGIPENAIGIWGHIFYRIEVRRRKSAQRKKQIRKLLHEFSSSAKALPDATVVLDRDFTIQWINKMATKLIGIHKLDAGQVITNLIRNPDFSSYLQMGDHSQPIEMVSPVDFNKRLILSLVPYGKEQYLLIARDRTTRHRLEQVRQDFIGNASHELRTPLSVLQGSLEQLEDMEGIERYATPLSRMKRQVTRMRSIMQDLLTLARIEGGEDATEQNAISLNELMQDVLEEVKLYSQQRGGHAILFTYDDEYQVLINRTEMHTVISNLVTNAINYTEAGGEIEMQLVRERNGVRVRVRDTGAGIPKEHIDRLTERFYRVDTGRSREVGGTGLGLAIVKHVLEQYGSALNIESQLGKGSEFSFLISASLFSDKFEDKMSVAH